MDHLSSQIDDKTAAVIVNSPSNPCGGVFSLEHIQQIIDVCDKHKVPIISDEVYEHVVSYAFYVLIPRISSPAVLSDIPSLIVPHISTPVVLADTPSYIHPCSNH